MYAAGNGGRYPQDFAALLLTQDLTAEVFVCSSSQGERAPGDTPAEQAKHLSDPLHMTYVYVAKGMMLPAGRAGDTLVAYEHLNHHNNDGMNFLYADGHVEFQVRAVAEHLVSEIGAGHNPPRAMDPARSGGR